MSTVLAVATMSPTIQALFYAAALICFFVVVFKVSSTRPEIFWIALGLMLFVFVLFWLTLSAT